MLKFGCNPKMLQKLRIIVYQTATPTIECVAK